MKTINSMFLILTGLLLSELIDLKPNTYSFKVILSQKKVLLSIVFIG